MSISAIGRRLERALLSSKGKYDHLSWDEGLIPLTASGLSHESSMVWTYHPFNRLNKSDFQSVDPSNQLKDIIKCRYSVNLNRTDQYLLQFQTPVQMEKYTSNVINNDTKLMGRALTLNTIDNIPMKSLRHVYPHIIPELKDLREVFKYKPFEEVDILIKQRVKQLKHMEDSGDALGSVINDYPMLLRNSELLRKDILTNTISPLTIERSQCVVLSNFNYKISPQRILDMVWDLQLHEEIPLRRVSVHKSTLRAVDVVIFKTKEDALCGVHRWNQCHGLYNDDIPYTTAEIL